MLDQSTNLTSKQYNLQNLESRIFRIPAYLYNNNEEIIFDAPIGNYFIKAENRADLYIFNHKKASGQYSRDIRLLKRTFNIIFSLLTQ